MKLVFPFVAQQESSDCGIACILMIGKFYNIPVNLDTLKKACTYYGNHLSMLDLEKGAISVGLSTISLKTTFENISNIMYLPCIIVWRKQHFTVLYNVTMDDQQNNYLVHLADPSVGLYVIPMALFLENWLDSEDKGYCILCRPNEHYRLVN